MIILAKLFKRIYMKGIDFSLFGTCRLIIGLFSGKSNPRFKLIKTDKTVIINQVLINIKIIISHLQNTKINLRYI